MKHLLTPTDAANWLKSRVRGKLDTDSRQLRAGDGFIAWPGAAVDGRQFVNQAIAAGASACLVEHEGIEAWGLNADDCVASFTQLKAATAQIAAEYYGHPSKDLDLLAVTGTNGKTSSAWWIAQLLQILERTSQSPCAVSCGLIGTLGTGIAPNLVSSGLTTPDPVLLQGLLRDFVDLGVKYCAIEASSIGIAERRLDATHIRVAIFTNLTHDHLDYHGDMARYWQAKAELFRWPGLRTAVVNVDDPQGRILAADVGDAGLEVWTVGRDAALQPRLLASNVGYESHAQGDGLAFDVTEGGVSHRVKTHLIGDYNVSNLLGVLAALRSLGFSLAELAQACAQATAVPGRMECITEAGQPMVVVDYAHTPDALEKALQGLRPLTQTRAGRLWCVFGCGGNRDATKRPLMAAIAERLADQVVVTSDNPRREDPKTIVDQILQGLQSDEASDRSDRVQVEIQRDAAIALALRAAGAKDVVLIAGKGHEDYQEVAGERLPFSDQAHAHAGLQRRRVVS